MLVDKFEDIFSVEESWISLNCSMRKKWQIKKSSCYRQLTVEYHRRDRIFRQRLRCSVQIEQLEIVCNPRMTSNEIYVMTLIPFWISLKCSGIRN